MRGLFTVLFGLTLLFHAAPADAQQRPGGGPPAAAELTGRVIDAETESPITSATVAVWDADDEALITGAVTREDGHFHIERIQPGSYTVRISYVGYVSAVDEEVTLEGGQELDLGTVALLADETQLDEVEVTAERETIEHGVDRTIYNVRNEPLSTGSSATDVLRNVPSVEVDIDGNVSLRGSENVAIHIDGRPAPMQGEFLAGFLEQLSAEMIERIEVLPNPSARYEPDGMAGIINIVLREDADLGLSGGLTVGADVRERYNASGNLGYQRGALNLYGSYGFRLGSNENSGFNFREQRFHSPSTFMEQDSFGENERTSHMVTTQAGYQLSPKDEISAQVTFNTHGNTSVGTNDYMLYDPNQTLAERYERLREAQSDGLNSSLRLGYDRRIERSSHELTADLRLSHNRNANENYFLQQDLTLEGAPSDEFPERQFNDLDNQTTRLDATVDYMRPLRGNWQLEAGYNGSLRLFANDRAVENYDYAEGIFRIDESQTNAFDFDEHIHAVYGQLGRQIGRFDLQAGLRLEQAYTTFDLTTTGERFDNSYFSLFPTANAVYSLSDAHRLRASYSKRVQRPHTMQLNPFTSEDDPLNLFRGNPYLEPEYTHSIEGGYQQFAEWGMFSVTPFFRRTVNAVRPHRSVDSNGVTTTTFENLATANSYGLETSLSVRLGERFNLNTGVNAHRLVTDGSNVEANLDSRSLVWSLRGSATVQLRQGLSLQAFGMYRAPTTIEQGRISSFAMTNIALRQQLLGDRASLNLRIMDPFDTMNFGFETDTEQLFQRSERFRDSRSVQLSFTYSFGQRQQRNRPRPDQDGSEEVDMDSVILQ